MVFLPNIVLERRSYGVLNEIKTFALINMAFDPIQLDDFLAEGSKLFCKELNPTVNVPEIFCNPLIRLAVCFVGTFNTDGESYEEVRQISTKFSLVIDELDTHYSECIIDDLTKKIIDIETNEKVSLSEIKELVIHWRYYMSSVDHDDGDEYN